MDMKKLELLGLAVLVFLVLILASKCSVSLGDRITESIVKCKKQGKWPCD